MEKRDLGRQGEQTAEQFLRERGYEIVTRNYRCTYGEIDLVARSRATLVFVEVRTQSGPTFGDPLESITQRKQRQIAKAALHYVVRQQVENQPLRFDVIGIFWNNSPPQIVHVKGAFELPSSRW
ncbi:MAG: YraN family protein [Candidatus Binatia bacterium]